VNMLSVIMDAMAPLAAAACRILRSMLHTYTPDQARSIGAVCLWHGVSGLLPSSQCLRVELFLVLERGVTVVHYHVGIIYRVSVLRSHAVRSGERTRAERELRAEPITTFY
jgi:hypothetical protein